jgi:hypothetical protein
MTKKRDEKGLWKKGKSGNPKGRPPAIPKEVREMCREHTTSAVETLVDIMLSPEAPPAQRIVAANSLLDRGYGKPSQHVSITKKHSIKEMTDDELYRIASGAGAVSEKGRKDEPNRVH